MAFYSNLADKLQLRTKTPTIDENETIFLPCFSFFLLLFSLLSDHWGQWSGNFKKWVGGNGNSSICTAVRIILWLFFTVSNFEIDVWLFSKCKHTVARSLIKLIEFIRCIISMFKIDEWSSIETLWIYSYAILAVWYWSLNRK